MAANEKSYATLAALAEELGMELIAEARQLSVSALEKHRAGRQIIAAAREHHEARKVAS